MKAVFYTGSYAASREPGICRWAADFEARKFTCLQTYSGIENPSYVLLHPQKNVLYSVSEKTPRGELWAFRAEASQLVRCCTLPSGGADPCHLALHGSGNWLAVSNYTSGTLAVFQMDDGGLPIRMTDLVRHTGTGVRPDRQQGPHVHFAQFRDDTVYAVDLGLDRVACYTLDTCTGTLRAGQTLRLPDGSGPRHLAFAPGDPDRLYVLCELGSAVVFFQNTELGWREVQSCSTLPEEYDAGNLAAAIWFSEDGKVLFTSNRGHDSVAVFAVAEDGRLRRTQICKTGGAVPRDFHVFGRCLVCANQGGSHLTVLRYDSGRESLEPYPMETAVGQPVCICRESFAP